MAHRTLAGLLLLFLAVPFARGQSVERPTTEERGTFLGALFSAIPDARYAQLANLPRGQGVLITHVLRDSPAAAAELQRDDVLVQYDAEKVRDCEHLARLIREDRPGRKVMLVYLRDGREKSAAATLTLGPVLQTTSMRKAALRDSSEIPRAAAKQGGPPAVSVACTPQADGSVKLTIEYFPDNSSRLRTVVCAGSASEIDREVQKLPSRVQELTRLALGRIRALELQKSSQPNSAPKPR